MNRRLILRLTTTILIALLVMSFGSVTAETNVTKIRTLSRGVSLRSDPWVGSNNKIVGVPADTTLDVYDEIKEGLGWYYVFYNGMWGYVASCDADGIPFVTIVATNGGGNDSRQTSTPYYPYDEPYDMGVPQLKTNVTKIRTLSRGASLRSDPWVGSNNKIVGVHADTTLDVYDEVNGWYYVYYNGMWGYVASCDADGTPFVTIVATNGGGNGGGGGGYQPTNGGGGYQPPTITSEPYDMGVPQLNGKVYRLNQMNMDVYWVQVQLKATGIWYQGEIWDCSGNLGDQTMSEIASFMRSRGYLGHSGVVDQSVVNELAAYLGNRVVPVYVGGFYDSMNSIMVGGSSGSMYQITSNLRDMVARETIGARWVQAVLKRLGYYNSTIDGKYGEGTDQAVKRFQRDHGFQERDYVSLGVARAMLEQYYYRGYSMYELP